MRILLVNPNPMNPPVTPVALDYLASACLHSGITVDLVDCSVAPDWRNCLRDALKEKPLLVGVTVRNIDDSYFASRDFSLLRILPVLDEIKRLTDAPLCLGGVGFSIFPSETLALCGVPYGICGSGEESIVRLVRALAEKTGLENVPGLVWKENGVYRKNAVRPVSLETMDLAARPLIDNARYFTCGGQVGFETKRGCAMNCVYCPEPAIRGRDVRLRNPANVAAELTTLYHRGIDVFHTCDSEFNSPYTHAVAVAEAVIKSGLGDKIKWYAYCSPETFTDELAGLMRRAGCVGIDFGADHGDDAMLKRLGHGYTSAALTRIREICTRHGITCMYDLLLGSPGETRASIETAIGLMQHIQPERVGISLGIRLYPVTPMGRKITGSPDQTLSEIPGLFGELNENPSLLRPVYYCDPNLGEDVEDWLHDLIGDDPRFLLGRRTDAKLNYNYNDNPELSAAIKAGHRGAYWDILRRLSENLPPL